MSKDLQLTLSCSMRHSCTQNHLCVTVNRVVAQIYCFLVKPVTLPFTLLFAQRSNSPSCSGRAWEAAS